MKPLKVLIVDDEPIAVTGMEIILQRETDVSVASCSSGKAAIEQIRQRRPDVVLLDIEMPEVSGFDVISEIGTAEMPFVVFVTAYQEFALQAFEVHAFDYILKPVDRARVVDLISRVRKQIRALESLEYHHRLDALVQTIEAGNVTYAADRDRIAIKSRGSIIMLPTNDVLSIEAAGNYVRFNIDNASYLSRTTMNQIEGQLLSKRFQRIHRSAIVNVDRIVQVTPISSVELKLKLDNGKELICSKSYSDRLKNLIKLI